MTSPHPRPMSIVLGVTSGQSLRLMSGLPEYLASRGWQVHVVCSDPRTNHHPDWTLHSIPMQREPSPLRDLQSLARWVGLLFRLRPTVVAVGTPKAGLLGTVAATLTLRPCRIYMLRGLRLSTTKGPKRALLRAMEQLAMLLSTRVHSISHSLVIEATSLRLAPPDKFVVLGAGSSNGVSVPPEELILVDKAIRRSELGLRADPTIGYVGRLTPDKGLDVLLTAFAELRKSRKTQLLIVGPEESPGYLDSVCASAGLTRDDVQWIGPVSDPAPYYSAMDVLCLPTKREGFGNVILEAAAYRVPAIASSVTGCVDAVVDGVTGHLVPPNDAGALAQTLKSVLADPYATSRLGAAARTRVERDFTREHVWRQTEQFYRDQLEGPGPTGVRALSSDDALRELRNGPNF